MNHFFKNFPVVDYDIKKNGKTITVPNITVGVQIHELMRKKKAVFYNYNVSEGERADAIAFKYYDDASLDWVIFLTNQIIDPQFEWPLSNKAFINYVTKKYGSITAATSTIHHYEQILQGLTVTFDNIIIPERYVEVDLATYTTVFDQDGTTARIIYDYDYELRLNNARSEIKLLEDRYVISLVNQVQEIFR